jgi:medium-chain acyl-[acyl-carrier-protein] hydrolase
MSSNWFIRYEAPKAPAMRLFCFPSAGSGAAQFHRWLPFLPASVELNAVQLPGRESRLREPLFTQAAALVEALCAALRDKLELPFAFLGHSLGAMLAFETTRALRAIGAPLPFHIFIIGRRAPHLPFDDTPLYQLSDKALLVWMRKLGGTPDRLLEIPEMVALFLPILRADLKVNETYEYFPQPVLNMPISCFGGVQDDQASRAQLEAWHEHTSASHGVRMYPGGHFFLKDYQSTLLRDISQDLSCIVEQ